jgi:hypothetical protein
MQAQTPTPAAARAIIELRYYRLRSGPQVQRTTDYLQHGLVPAAERAGIRPLGCFNALIAPDTPFLLTVTSYPSLAAIETAREKLAADTEFQAASPRRSMHHARAIVHAHGKLAAVGVPVIPARWRRLPPARIAPPISSKCAPTNRPTTRSWRAKSGCSATARSRSSAASVCPRCFSARPSSGRACRTSPTCWRSTIWPRARSCGTPSTPIPEWQKLRVGPGLTDPEVVGNITNVILRPLPFSPIR